MKNKTIAYIILALVIGFNAYLYRNELKILSDVNDNIFQYALVDEAAKIIDNISKGKLSIFYLFDSHNERWNEGFALSTYYSHLPQAVIVMVGKIGPAFAKASAGKGFVGYGPTSSRLAELRGVKGYGLFGLFNLIKYLFLVLTPITFFIGALILGLPYLTAALVALIAQLTFTNGLYGVDIASYMWRGWGLSSQLMAVFFLPLAFGYSYNYLTDKKNLGKAVFFNFLVASFHFGVFYMAALGYGVVGVMRVLASLRQGYGRQGGVGDMRDLGDLITSEVKKVVVLGGLIFLTLAYFIIPFYLFDNYRNFSFWDPMWKFDSFGINQAVTWFLNGEFFDFGRMQIVTGLVIIGVLAGLGDLACPQRQQAAGLRGGRGVLAVLFLFYFLIFFGRAGWGGLINIVPGLSEFHIHRFIVMIQFCGIYLAGWVTGEIIKKIGGIRQIRLIGLIGVLILLVVSEKPIVNYVKENDLWLKAANESYIKDRPDYNTLVKKLKTLPSGRVYVGRPGNWGREFRVGGTTLYMALSRDGFPTVGFGPESWSPNSEIDQFFNEYQQESYSLFNVRYLIAPESFKKPDFGQLIDKFGRYYLYEVKTDGWYTFGKTPFAVVAKKDELVDVVKQWQTLNQGGSGQAGMSLNQYPRVIFKNDQKDYTGKKIEIVDMTGYKDDEGRFSTIWNRPMIYLPANFGTDADREEVLTAGYKTSFTLLQDCDDCIVVLKQTFHPNWNLTINGKEVDAFPVFPFYIGVPLSRAGSYTVEAVYGPNRLKTTLIVIEVLVFSIWYLVFCIWRKKQIK